MWNDDVCKNSLLMKTFIIVYVTNIYLYNNHNYNLESILRLQRASFKFYYFLLFFLIEV